MTTLGFGRTFAKVWGLAMAGLVSAAGADASATPAISFAAAAAAYDDPITCASGYVWREAAPGDYVCVGPESRARAQSENASAMSRVDPYGAYGPQTCVAGYVWREAFAGDRVCVTPEIRGLVASENTMGPGRRAAMAVDPYLPTGSYPPASPYPLGSPYPPTGPYPGASDPSLACRAGFVWREAGPGDLVCVTPQSRDRARSDNASQLLRVNPFGGGYGPGTCLPGYVWREAFVGDRACVKPNIRTRTAQENAEAAMNRVGPGYPVDPYAPGGGYPGGGYPGGGYPGGGYPGGGYPGGGYGPPPVAVPVGARCRMGFVWREAGPGDLVCVPPGSRSRAAQENAYAASRVNPYGSYGPQTCISGFVWREAFAGDRVCVTPAIRDLVRSENLMAASRREGVLAPPVYVPPPGPVVATPVYVPPPGPVVATPVYVPPPGPVVAIPVGPPMATLVGRCRSGFVWREARPGDRVCVPPGSRSRAALENSLASSRVNPTGAYGPQTCVAGFVWREAFAGDRVCVTPAIRSLVQNENAMAASRREP